LKFLEAVGKTGAAEELYTMLVAKDHLIKAIRTGLRNSS